MLNSARLFIKTLDIVASAIDTVCNIEEGLVEERQFNRTISSHNGIKIIFYTSKLNSLSFFFEFASQVVMSTVDPALRDGGNVYGYTYAGQIYDPGVVVSKLQRPALYQNISHCNMYYNAI